MKKISGRAKRFAMGLAILGAAALLSPAAARASDVIVSNWGAAMYGVPYAVALQKGFFKDENAPVTGAVGGGAGGSVVRNLLANELPFGEIASSAAMDAQLAGLPLVIVAGSARGFDATWMTLPDSPVKTIKDLVGKRVAYTSPQSISEAFLLMILRGNGIDANSVTRVATGGYAESLTMLAAGGVDVGPGTEPVLTARKGKFRAVFSAEEALPPILTVVAVTTRDFAAKHPDEIRAILKARRRGVEYIYAHPQEAGAIMADAYNLDPAVSVEAIEKIVTADQKMWSTGEIDIGELTNLQQGFLLTGAKVGGVDWPKLIDLSYLPADLQAKSKFATQ